jgi:hypothetical protein
MKIKREEKDESFSVRLEQFKNDIDHSFHGFATALVRFQHVI